MKIAQVMATDAWDGITPEHLESGIGGREGAMIRLAREWARLGHEVTNYVPAKEPKRYREGDGMHEYVSVGISRAALANFEYDAVVAWECPSVFNRGEIMDIQGVRLVEMQCAHFPSDEEQLCAGTVATGVCALSPWHRDFMVHDGLEIDADRLHVLPNCVDLEHYPEADAPEFKLNHPLKMVYSSSPDRGLWHLLKAWPILYGRFPGAELSVAYGTQKWLEQALWSHGRIGQMAMELAQLLGQAGVKDLGKIGHEQLSALQREATVWAYPLDAIQPTETGCITAIEAMAAYCPVVTTDCDCMAEEFSSVASIVPLPFDEGTFAEDVISVISDYDQYCAMQAAGRAFAESRQWSEVAKKWISLFEAEAARS